MPVAVADTFRALAQRSPTQYSESILQAQTWISIHKLLRHCKAVYSRASSKDCVHCKRVSIHVFAIVGVKLSINSMRSIHKDCILIVSIAYAFKFSTGLLHFKFHWIY